MSLLSDMSSEQLAWDFVLNTLAFGIQLSFVFSEASPFHFKFLISLTHRATVKFNKVF